MAPTRTLGPLILSMSRSYEPVGVDVTPQNVRPSSAHIMFWSTGTLPTGWPSESLTRLVPPDVLGRRQRSKPSGDWITVSGLRLLTCFPVQSSPCRSFEGPRYQMSGPELLGVTAGDALIDGTTDGLGLGATRCPLVRNDQRTLIC